MITYTRVIGTPGLKHVFIPPYVTPLCVCREGIEFDRNLIAAANRKYKYTASTGKVLFNEEFSGDPFGDRNSLEKVYVRYKY